MARKIGSSFSCVATSFSSPFQFTGNSRVRFFGSRQFYSEQLRNVEVVKKSQFPCGKFKLKERFLKQQYTVLATSEDLLPDTELKPDEPEQDILTEDLATVSTSDLHVYPGGTGGKPGLISFYNHPYKTESEVSVSCPGRNENNVLWFVAPAVLVASFVFPSLYLRRVLSTVFEDSLLTDFLILFFTEALFYCGVAIFILIVDYLWRCIQPLAAANDRSLASQLGHRVTTVAVLVLSLVIPMVTMGLVWPWTGPAASATLAPYLVGIVVQFAFEQYARYVKSPSWPVIPVIFQIYRLHQLNRAAQLVTALSFTVRGAEMTSHNVAINSSLGTLLNVLQFLGVICIWSLSSFLMRFLPSATTSEQ